MSSRKVLAAVVCIAVLGAQLRASLPISRVTQGWYWPFLSYPMYAIAHERGDSLVVPELRVATCGSTAYTTIETTDSLGVPRAQLNNLLYVIARSPNASGAARVSAKITHVLDAQFPGRYCAASVWTRVVFVTDTATHHVRAPMRRVAEWAMNGTGGE